MLTLGEVAAIVDEIAPFRLAYDWDNVGVLVGNTEQPVRKVLLALEINTDAIKMAKASACEAIITHHPVIFKPLRSLRTDAGEGRLLYDLVGASIGVISAHTNLDQVLHGTNGALAEKLNLQQLQVLDATTLDEKFKLTVFVPRPYTEKVIEAIHRGGGGWIGNYSHCTFRAPGVGTYVPEKGSHPYHGSAGNLENAEEDRLETLVNRHALKNVLREVMLVHPYEEVAYDVFPLHDAKPLYGLGCVGLLPNSMSLRALAEGLRQACNAESVRVTGPLDASLTKVAIITGSAGTHFRTVTPGIADVLVTGELSYHHTVEARDRGLNVIVLGHAAGEKIFASHLRKQILEITSEVEVLVFEEYPEPFITLGGSPS